MGHGELVGDIESRQGALSTTLRTSTARYALVFCGMVRSLTLRPVQQSIEDSLITPNAQQGGIDVFYHLYMEPDQGEGQSEGVRWAREHQHTAGMALEWWNVSFSSSAVATSGVTGKQALHVSVVWCRVVRCGVVVVICVLSGVGNAHQRSCASKCSVRFHVCACV